MKNRSAIHQPSGSLNRRSFLSTGLSLATLAASTPVWTAQTPGNTGGGLIDVNVSVGQWPFRRLPHDEPAQLVQLLKKKDVQQAWVGNFEALFHKDLGAANRRLAAVCKQAGAGLLVPFGTVNPGSPDWKEELDRCARLHRMPGIRLHPNYHGYKLDEPRFAELLREAGRRHLIVQISIVQEDERMMHPLARVEPVDTTPLPALSRSMPELRIVLLNALRTVRARPLLNLIATGNIQVEISNLEGIGGLETLLGQIPESRILFGSHAPLFYFDSALLKLKESELKPAQLQSIRSGNARRLLEGRS